MPPSRAAQQAHQASRRRVAGVELTRPLLAAATIVQGVVAGLGLAIVGVLVGLGLTAAHPLQLDATGLAHMEITNPWVLAAARALGYLGHALVVGPAAALIGLLARRRWGSWHLGLLLLTTLGGATAVTAVVKLLTARSRPDDALVATLSSAFPSGHAVRAAAIYGLLAWLVWRLARRTSIRHAVLPATVVLVALNGFARVALGAHWPTDVLAGFVIGAAWLACTLAILRPRPLPRPAPTAHDVSPRNEKVTPPRGSQRREPPAVEAPATAERSEQRSPAGSR